MKKITPISQKKLAESLGMPKSTVANILNGTPHYKKETRERVFEAVKKFGYQPNRASRALKRGRSNLIGLIYFSSIYEVSRKAARHLPEIVNDFGFDYLVVDSYWHAKNIDRVLNEIIQTRVEGVILGGSAYHICGPEHIATLEQTGIPVVSHLGDDMDVPTVGDDARSSFFTMARHLQNVGHRSILMPAFLTPERSAFNRVEGFKLAMKGWGEYHEIDQKDFLREWPSLYKKSQDTPIGVIVKLDPANLPLAEGHDITQIYYKLSKGLFAAGKLPDAIMAINDAAAFGVYNAAFEMKINIPADIALTGADDDYFGQLPMFRLTTIRQNILQSCKAAVEMLVQRIKTGDATVMPDQCFHSEIALRQSCGRLIAASEDPVLYLPVATSN